MSDIPVKRGGRRPGAGRPKGTGKFGEPTQVIRIPKSWIPDIKQWIDKAQQDNKSGKTVAMLGTFAKTSANTYPLYTNKIPAGFPSPADDHIDSQLDLNDLLVKHPAATFFVRVEGDSMIGAGIHSGDILVVDRSIEATSGKVVIAVVDSELTVKRLSLAGGKTALLPENPAYNPIEIGEDNELHIWGVVTNVIHSV